MENMLQRYGMLRSPDGSTISIVEIDTPAGRKRLSEMRRNGWQVRGWIETDMTAGALRRGRNRLQIRVTNTLANAVTPNEVRDRWYRELPFVSPYEYLSRWFEQESLPSGLYGPVTLLERR